MLINRAYRTELDPNNKQKTLLLKSIGASRFAYNWGLEQKKNIHLLNQLPTVNIKSPTAIDLHRYLNKLKKTKYPWLYEVSKCAPQEALRDLDKSFKNFFDGRSRFPRYKSRKSDRQSFRLTGRIHVYDNHIQLPRLGKIRLKERDYIPKDAHILSATVTLEGDRWFVSVAVEEEIEIPDNNGDVAGVDVGIHSLATVSDGTVIPNPRALDRYKRKLKRQQKEPSRKKKGSKNWHKNLKRLRKTHMRIRNIRKDVIHKSTTWLARTKSVVVVEDLNVRGMTKNHHLAGSILDSAFGEFRRQLEYKCQWYGSKVIVADRFYPSSKMCSRCGSIKHDLKLSDRIYKCPECGLVMDRDLNAAINLMKLAVSSTESLNACMRQEVAGSNSQCLPMIQEVSSNMPIKGIFGQILRNGGLPWREKERDWNGDRQLLRTADKDRERHTGKPAETHKMSKMP